ncbi:MAG: transposase [Verrucomicrobiota bacterium]|nr:transposase [Verrucomicrobiota bacterium]
MNVSSTQPTQVTQEGNIGGTGAVPSQTARLARAHPTHQPVVERFNTAIIVFLTVCSKDRKPILSQDDVHQLLRDSFNAAESWVVGRYVVMPDHIHLFCAPGDLMVQPLAQWVSYWKSHAARHWPRPNESPIWQRHFWDTQLRRGENYDQKWDYVIDNPVRARLVEKAEDWPYAGELHELRW